MIMIMLMIGVDDGDKDNMIIMMIVIKFTQEMSWIILIGVDDVFLHLTDDNWYYYYCLFDGIIDEGIDRIDGWLPA